MSKELHDKILSLPCPATQSQFATRHELNCFKNGHQAAREASAALALDAAAHQVAADERVQSLLSGIGRTIIGLRDGWGDKNDADEAIANIAEVKSALAAAPVQAQEPVAEVSAMPGTSGFTMAVFKADDMPIGSKVFRAPVQPVAVPDGGRDAALEEAIRLRNYNEAAADQLAGYIAKYFGIKIGVGDESDPWDDAVRVIEDAPPFAAPAAQGDAHKSPASFSDHIRWVIAGVRNGHGADDVAINNMRAWHESKVKASKAPVADKKSIRYDFLRLDDQQYYVAFRDQFGAFRQIREKELDKTIDAAIAAKAAS